MRACGAHCGGGVRMCSWNELREFADNLGLERTSFAVCSFSCRVLSRLAPVHATVSCIMHRHLQTFERSEGFFSVQLYTNKTLT